MQLFTPSFAHRPVIARRREATEKSVFFLRGVMEVIIELPAILYCSWLVTVIFNADIQETTSFFNDRET